MIWNWFGMGITMLVGFLIAPFLVHKLGETDYGLWILISSFTNYFGLLDLGVRGSVGRNVAYSRARGDSQEVNRVVNTALVALGGTGLLALLATCALVPLFPALFDIPADKEPTAQAALLLVGLNLALWLPLNVFDATLWGHQRFDLLNGIDIPVTVLRAALTYVLIGSGYELVTLSLINLASLAGGQAVKAVACYRLIPDLRLRPGLGSWACARQLYSYGIWNIVFSLTRMMTGQISPILIGALLGVRSVVVYSIASRLIGYVGALLGACTGVLTPVATAFHAGAEHDKQRAMFLRGSACCCALSLFFFSCFLVLGRSLLTIWMGPGMEEGPRLLAILATGEVLPLTQFVTQSLILGMARHRAMALMGLAENAVAIGLALVLCRSGGLAGVCVAFAVSATLFRGLALAVYGCRVAGIAWSDYLARAVLPPVASAALPSLALWLAASYHEPTNWAELVVYGGAYAAGYALCCRSWAAGPGLKNPLPTRPTLLGTR